MTCCATRRQRWPELRRRSAAAAVARAVAAGCSAELELRELRQLLGPLHQFRRPAHLFGDHRLDSTGRAPISSRARLTKSLYPRLPGSYSVIGWPKLAASFSLVLKLTVLSIR